MLLACGRFRISQKLTNNIWLSYASLRQCSKLPHSVNETRIISQADVDSFARLTGDFNPIHLATQPIEKRVVHGALLNGLVSGVIGGRLPGPGSIVVSQSFRFPNRCVVDKPIEVRVELLSARKLLDVAYECQQDGRTVFKGTARLVMQK